jgi:hypothetical protein
MSTIQSLRSRVGSVFRRPSGTFSTESDEERPPSPGGSSIKSNPSKRKRRLSIFRPDGKRAPGGPTRPNTSGSSQPVGTVDSPSHTGEPPVGEDGTILPKQLEASSTDTPAADDAREVHVEPLVSRPHQTPVEGYFTAAPALTTEQEEVLQFSAPRPQPTGEGEGEKQTEGAATQIGSDTATPQTQASTELKTADIALSSSVASAFEIIHSLPEPEPAKDENDSLQKSVER